MDQRNSRGSPPETEEDGYRPQAVRLLKARQMLQEHRARTRASSPSQSNTLGTTASTSGVNPNLSR